MLNIKAILRKNSKRSKRTAAKKRVPPQLKRVRRVLKNVRRKARGPRGPPSNPLLRMSECAYQYARAIGDPWHPDSLGACVPLAAGITQKVTGFIRTTGAIGANGFGMVLVSPCLASDCTCILTSLPGFLGSAAYPFTPLGFLAPNVQAATCANLPYKLLDMIPLDEVKSGGSAAQQLIGGRIVSCGIRIRYTGRVIDQSGTCLAYRNPFHSSVQVNALVPPAGADRPFYGSQRETQYVPWCTDWVSQSDFAYIVDEQDLSNFTRNQNSDATLSIAKTQTLYPFSQGENSFLGNDGMTWTPVFAGAPIIPGMAFPPLQGIPTVGFLLAGIAGTGYDIEYIIHAEYSGTQPGALGTRSPVDPVGTQKVLDAGSDAVYKMQAYNKPTLWQSLVSNLHTLEKELVPRLVPIAQSAAAMYGMYNQQAHGRLVLNYNDAD